MKRPLCCHISLALIVLCSIGTSNANVRRAGVHTGHHRSSSTMSVASDSAPIEAKAGKPTKPEQHHAGNGGKHDTGVDGNHPVEPSSSSKAGKPVSVPSDNSWESPPASNSWDSPALSHPATTKGNESKSGKPSGKTDSGNTDKTQDMSYAKSDKDSITYDSKAEKGDENAKSYKEAPNEYNGVKYIVKTPENGNKQPKAEKDTDAGKETDTWSGGESGDSSAKPEKDSKSGKIGTVESDGGWSSGGGAAATTTTTTSATAVAEGTEFPAPAETTTAATESVADPAATTPQAVQKAAPAPEKRIEGSPDEQQSPTYSPTVLVVEQTASVEETFTAMDPFGLRFLSSKQQPSFDLDSVTKVTTEHLLHSFRAKGWDADRLQLMLLDDEDRRRSLRRLDSFPVHELVFGGILYFKTTSEMPSKEVENALVEDSFSGDRLSYFVNLLNEEGVDVASASWGHLATSSEPSTGGIGGNKIAIILGSVLGSIGVFVAVVLLVRLYNKRSRRIQVAKGPNSLVFRIKDEVENMEDYDRRDASTIPTSIEDNVGASRYSYYSKQPRIPDPVSPLDIPDDTVSTSTRYVSVFTVKKDCGGRTLEQVDLRSLAVAYLSRLFKKVPDTNLLPYDKESTLPVIKSIRNIPDDVREVLEYVGNPRIDENTGKVLFNLRCESDVPMSKMKNLSSKRLPKPMSRSTVSEDQDHIATSGFEDVTL